MVKQQGFSLVELLVSVAIGSIVAVAASTAFSTAIKTNDAASNLQRLNESHIPISAVIGQELKRALPGSVRVSTDGAYVEFLPVSLTGRYRASCAVEPSPEPCASGEDKLDMTRADDRFDVVGQMASLPASNSLLVINNTGIGSFDAYSGGNTSVVTSATPTRVVFSPKIFPGADPLSRFSVVGSPISYVCTGTTLVRVSGYAMQAIQPTSIAATPLAGATKSVISDKVDCSGTRFRLELPATASSGEFISLSLRNVGGVLSSQTYYAWRIQNAA